MMCVNQIMFSPNQGKLQYLTRVDFSAYVHSIKVYQNRLWSSFLWFVVPSQFAFADAIQVDKYFLISSHEVSILVPNSEKDIQ
jgi:hypothetical protein